MQLPSQVPINLVVREGDVGVKEINETNIIDVDGPDEVVVSPNIKWP